MSNAHNPQHWSQLDMDEQIRFWQGVEDGHVASFLVSRRRNPPSPARRALHKNPNVKTRPGFDRSITKTAASWGTPITVLFKKIAPLVRCDCVCTYRFIRCTSGNVVGLAAGMASGRKSNVCWMLSGQC